MNRFADLLDRLSYEPRRNAKIRLMADYFARTPDPGRSSDAGTEAAVATEGMQPAPVPTAAGRGEGSTPR